MTRLFRPLWAFFTLLALAGCTRPGGTAGARVLRISQRNEPDELDPARARLPDDFFITRALSEGLVVPGGDGGPPRPAAADRWTVSPDGTVWTFHLRPSARWSNGEPVTSHDFLASYQRELTPGTAAPQAEVFFGVRNARRFATGALTDFSQVGFGAPRPDQFVVTLSQPLSGFLDYAASGPWIPVNPRVVALFGRAWTRPGNFVGNGPFQLTQWRPNARLVVRKNFRYWGAAAIQVDELQFLRFDDDATEERAYRTQALDVTMKVPTDLLPLYARERPNELHRAALAETRYLTFNLQRPPLNDLRVRRALALAIDREALADEVLRAGQRPAGQMLPPELSLTDQAASPGSAPAPAPVAEAQRLLAEAGFASGARFPRLELAGWSNNPVLEAIQQMWRKRLGIEVAIINREATAHLALVQGGHYDIGFLPLIPQVPDPLPVLARFVTGAAEDYPRWSDPTYDRLIAAAAGAQPEARRHLLAQAAARLADQCPVTPLYYNAHNWAMRAFVYGWREDAFWNRYYPGLSLDPAPGP